MSNEIYSGSEENAEVSEVDTSTETAEGMEISDEEAAAEIEGCEVQDEAGEVEEADEEMCSEERGEQDDGEYALETDEAEEELDAEDQEAAEEMDDCESQDEADEQADAEVTAETEGQEETAEFEAVEDTDETVETGDVEETSEIEGQEETVEAEETSEIKGDEKQEEVVETEETAEELDTEDQEAAEEMEACELKDEVDEQADAENQEMAEDVELDEDEEAEETEADVAVEKESKMTRSFEEDFSSSDLFQKHKKGDYDYSENEVGGKSASGSLEISDDPKRDAKAQREAGGEARRSKYSEYGVDDGGHFIGARFGGETGEENLTAQDRNLNRGGYKSLENEWAKEVKDGNNVFVNIEADKADRPNAYVGYSITESEDGHRTWDAFSFTNESRAEQESWEKVQDEFETENGSTQYDDFRDVDTAE